jgi:hypothetical protein
MSQKQLEKMHIELQKIGLPIHEADIIVDLMYRCPPYKPCRSLRGLIEHYKSELCDSRFSVPTQMFFRALVGQKCHDGFDRGHVCAIFYQRSTEDMAQFENLMRNFWQNKFLSNFLNMHNQRKKYKYVN